MSGMKSGGRRGRNCFGIQDTLPVLRLEYVGKSGWIESLDMK